jgi:outer membrane biosynthesis protein TonB
LIAGAGELRSVSLFPLPNTHQTSSHKPPNLKFQTQNQDPKNSKPRNSPKNQKPKTKNQKPKTKNQKPKTKNQKQKTKNQKPKTKNKKQKIKNKKSLRLCPAAGPVILPAGLHHA